MIVEVIENWGDVNNQKLYTAIIGIGDVTVDLTQFAPARGDSTFGNFWGPAERPASPPEFRTISSGYFEAVWQ